MADAPKPRWIHLTPDRLVLLLLAIEGLLWLSERFQLFPKGYAVLIAVASVGVFMLAVFLWFAAALIFRWRFQYSIRSLLVLTVAVAIPCSWLAVEKNEARQQRAAAVVFERFGGNVIYDYMFDQHGSSLPNPKPPGPAWLRQLLGENFFTEIEELDLIDNGWHRQRGHEIKDAELEYLKGLTKLKRLFLNGTQVSDAGLKNLKGLTQLLHLWLSDTKVSDAGLEHLRGLTQLQWLSLGGTQVTDAGLEHLKGLRQLRTLDLYDTRVGDAGLEHLKKLTQLNKLDLNGTGVSDAGLEHLKGLTQLQELDLSGTKVSDAGLEHLKGLTQLRVLHLNGTKVSDAGVAKLQEALPRCRIVQ